MDPHSIKIPKATKIGPEDNQFLVIDFLGKGTFSRCYTLKSCTTSNVFAGKFINKAKVRQFKIMQCVTDEIHIHRSLKHTNIVEFHDFFEDKHNVYIILEHCPNYSLAQMLKRRKYLYIYEAKYFMLQITSAVEYLHKNHIMHRDLKLSNFFIDKNMCIKVGDFGLAACIEYNGHKRFSICGTPNYLSPEVINRKGHALAVDIWALGCILYTILVGQPPFQSSDTKSTCTKILQCEYTLPNHMRTSAKTFITNTLQADPEKRPTISELLTYEFLTSGLIPAKLPTSCLTLAPRKSDIDRQDQHNLSVKDANGSIFTSKKQDRNGHDLYNQLRRLKSLLVDVNEWKVSTIGEIEGEDPSSSPLIWINSWIDYSKLYGFAYRLNDDNVGVLFNDHSCMVMMPAGESIFYINTDGTENFFTTKNIDNTLKKKHSVLIHCRQYMFDSLKSAYDSSDESEPLNSVPILMHWQRFESCILMILSNGILQINFLHDHTKLILCPIMQTVTVINNSNNFRTIQLDALKKHGCSDDLMNRLSIVLFKIKQLLKTNS